VYFNIRNTLTKSGTFLLGHPVYDSSLYLPPIMAVDVWKDRLFDVGVS